MSTFVVAHGAWSAGWAWKKMRPRMHERGHEIWTPTYTGLGERAHLATPDITLDTHIEDVCGLLVTEDLRDVILIGHSYGGMVATGVADREPARIKQVVYLDAFVPRDGECLLDLHPPEIRERIVSAVLNGDGWRLPPNPPPPDTPEDDLAWMTARRMGQPAKTGTQPIRLTGAVERLPRTYIYCLQPRPGDVFRQFADRAKAEGWPYLEIDTSHNPHITAPDALAAMLHRIARAV